MAAGDTDVSIVNKGLLLLGAEAISSFSDGTPAGTAASTIYTEVKFTTLGMYPWSFTIAKTQLTRDSNTPQNEWTYQYLLPNDMLLGVPRAVRTSSSPGAALFKNWEIAQSSAGGAVLMTDATEVHIDYQKAVSEGNMPTYFVQLMAYQMAWHLAEVITDQTQKSEYWRSVALGTAAEGLRGGYFRQAANIDAGGQTPSVVGDYLLTDVR
jgi:hypothetical protein|tara:strand:+ start:335 stop:964 length:630 start_codon:yes stop_codon:yes gene_type:complete